MTKETIKMSVFKQCGGSVRYRETSATDGDGNEVEASIRDVYLKRCFKAAMPDKIIVTVEG